VQESANQVLRKLAAGIKAAPETREASEALERLARRHSDAP
jgi:hypothetical protein